MRSIMVQITININGGEVEVSQPEQVGPNDFRPDMNIKAALCALEDAYIEEAMKRVGEGKGQKTKAAEMLGFDSYQAFAYWLKRKEKRAASR